MTSPINFSGVGSSIDFSLIRDAVIAGRTQPITQLQARSSNLTSRSSSLKQLNGLLAAVTNASQALTDTTLGTQRGVDSSNSLIASGLATGAASIGTISLTVGRLASSLQQASASLPTSSGPILAGGATSATFELRMGGATTGPEITINSSNNSLAGLRDAINAAGAGVTASIVDLAGDGTQNQLVLSSTATGAAGRVELMETTAVPTGTATALNLRSLNPPGAAVDFSALNSEVTINGLTITRSTNSISDALTGVTFDLHQTGQATLTVDHSSDISDKITAFVTAYNSVQSFIALQYQKDFKGRPTGILAGDPTLRQVQQQLRNSIGGVSTGNGGTFTSLSDLGIGRDENGLLTLDKAVLESRVQNNFADVRALLLGNGNDQTGLFDDIHTSVSNMSDSITGVVQTAISGFDASVKTLAKSIADQTDRVNLLRDSLTRQFAAIDAAIGQLNSQGFTLTTMMDAWKQSA
jgi:flagellar hook-associated protein 2